MTILQDFTSADEIRAVLGVVPEELEDQTLELGIYLSQLQFDLADVSPTLESSYLAIKDLEASSRTAVQQKLFNVTSVYSSYFVSRLLLTSLPVFAPKQITDGKASKVRVDDPFSRVKEGVEAQYLVLRSRLLAALTATGVSVSAEISRRYVGSAGLSSSPVTNV